MVLGPNQGMNVEMRAFGICYGAHRLAAEFVVEDLVCSPAQRHIWIDGRREVGRWSGASALSDVEVCMAAERINIDWAAADVSTVNGDSYHFVLAVGEVASRLIVIPRRNSRGCLYT